MDLVLLPEADLLASLIDDGATAVDFKDREGRYLRVSQACARELGLTDPDSVPGHGTTFRVRLPLEADPTQMEIAA
jgi:hypothetical protein